QPKTIKTHFQVGFFISLSMRYHKLSEAQFREMHKEFSIFLAAQGINKEEWDKIKEESVEKVDYLLNAFSDLVWEKIISTCAYLEFSTPDQLYLFHTQEKSATVFVVKISPQFTDLTTEAGFETLLNQLHSDKVTLYTATKPYTPSRNEFIYSYLKKGATLSKGARYSRLQSYFSNSPK
ncbi:MAG: DUF6495 family protein, partial [Flavobacteriaceae bacterium]